MKLFKKIISKFKKNKVQEEALTVEDIMLKLTKHLEFINRTMNIYEMKVNECLEDVKKHPYDNYLINNKRSAIEYFFKRKSALKILYLICEECLKFISGKKDKNEEITSQDVKYLNKVYQKMRDYTDEIINGSGMINSYYELDPNLAREKMKQELEIEKEVDKLIAEAIEIGKARLNENKEEIENKKENSES